MGTPTSDTSEGIFGPPTYREAMEITERGLRSEYTKACAGVHLLRPPPKEPEDLRERVLFWERVVGWLPKMFKLRDDLAQLVRRGKLSRAEAKEQLDDQLKVVFPPNYVLWMEEGEMAKARCALAKARWNSKRPGRQRKFLSLRVRDSNLRQSNRHVCVASTTDLPRCVGSSR